MLKSMVATTAAVLAFASASAQTGNYSVSGTLSGVTIQGSSSFYSDHGGSFVDLKNTMFDLTFNANLADNTDGLCNGLSKLLFGSGTFSTRGIAYPYGHVNGGANGTYECSQAGNLEITKSGLSLMMNMSIDFLNTSGLLQLTADRLGDQFVNWRGLVFGDLEPRLPDAYSGFTEARFVATSASVMVGGAPPIPEPATWALMIAGFGIAGATIRRRPRPVFQPALS